MMGRLCGLILFFIVTGVVGYAQDKWEASKDSTWKGKEGTFYKLDPFCNVLSSIDRVNWVPNEQKVWQEKGGNWVKLEDRTLTYSTDRTMWNSISKWTDEDGMYFKVDENCVLHTMYAPEQKVSPFLQERRDYKKKMSRLTRDFDKQIASYKKRGKVKRKNRSYVQNLEAKKNIIKNKSREIYKKSDADWEAFKKDLDGAILDASSSLAAKK